MQCLFSGLLFEASCLHYPQCSLATELQKALNEVFTYAVVFSKTLKHTLLFKNVNVEIWKNNQQIYFYESIFFL